MAKRESGARASKIGISSRFKAWLKDHRRVAIASFQRLLQRPLSSLVTWLVIGIALALPVGFYVTLANVQTLGKQWQSTTQISLYLHQKTSDQAVESLHRELSVWPEIDELRLISKEEGLQDFQSLSGFSDVLKHLDHNPLPVVIEVLPARSHSQAAEAELLLQRLQKLPQVDIAQLDMEWLQRLALMLQIGQRMALAMVLLLSLGVLLIIGNTIRLEIENRRDEILVVKLVGGTDAFVRRPFLYTGLWYGLGGGILATLIVALGLAVLSEPVANLAGLYSSSYRLNGLSFTDTVSLWLMASLLGYFGAWLSVGQHLDELEPR